MTVSPGSGDCRRQCLRGGGRGVWFGLVWFGLASTRPMVSGVTLTVHARPWAWECENVSALPAHYPVRPLIACAERCTPDTRR